MIKITIPIEPVEQARPRAVRMRKGVRLYDPAKVRNYKSELALRTSLRYNSKPLTGPLDVRLKFYRHIQQSISKKERVLRLSGVHRPTVKPDTDNYIKSTLDALNGLLWADDNQIVDLSASKFYSDKPRVEIEVREIVNDTSQISQKKP